MLQEEESNWVGRLVALQDSAVSRRETPPDLWGRGSTVLPGCGDGVFGADLTTGKTEMHQQGAEFRRWYRGGSGVGTRFLYECRPVLIPGRTVA